MRKRMGRRKERAVEVISGNKCINPKMRTSMNKKNNFIKFASQ